MFKTVLKIKYQTTQKYNNRRLMIVPFRLLIMGKKESL